MYKVMFDLKRIANNLRKQGKTDEQIKNSVSVYLKESKRKINPNGDLDIV